MLDAITAMRASPAASGGSGTSSTWIDWRGSLSRDGIPSNIDASSLCTVTAR